MKKGVLVTILAVGVLLVILILSSSLAVQSAQRSTWRVWELRDGKYRGSYSADGYVGVALEITVKDQTITNIRINHMEYAGQDYLKKTGTGRVRPEALEGVAQQYIECANYLVGAKGID